MASCGNRLSVYFERLELGYDVFCIEDDLVYILNELSSELTRVGSHAEADWLWQKALKLCNDKSASVCYNYARLYIDIISNYLI
jgi:hypothetical protein